mmetsp:Transcript_1844/g.1732  ORF Transcript_1844/g.1732 Transcript_1844/m.1732 type:complete len:377 (-) Transcript_1844:397-1527(-)
MIATAYFIILTFVKSINPVTSAVFFAIYIVFFVIVIMQERAKKRKAEDKERRMNKLKKAFLPKTMSKQSSPWDSIVGPYLIKRMILNKRHKGKTVKMEDFKLEEKSDTDDSKEGATEEEEEEDNSCFGRFMKYYNMPLFFIRNLTMPPFEAENWSLPMALCSPFFGTLFIAWQTVDDFSSTLFWIVWACIAIFFAALIFIGSRGGQNLAEKHPGWLSFFTFIGAAMWINLTAGTFMDFLSMIQVVAGLPITYLSLTMLAWGNSLDDFFIDYVISKNGQGPMAVTGVYGGQLFNLLIGFGGSMFRNTITFGAKDFDFYDGANSSILILALIYSTLLCGVLTLLVTKSNGWVMGKGVKNFTLIYYVAFFLGVTALAFL